MAIIDDYLYSEYFKILPILGKLGLVNPKHIKVDVREYDGYVRKDILQTYSGGFGTFRNDR